MSIENVKPAEAQKWVESGEAVIVDVREQDEFNQEHIAQAVLYPLSSFDADAVIKGAEGKKIVMQCASGKRAGQACQTFVEKHPETQIYLLEDGIQGWKNAGLPTEKKKGGARIPLDRQVLVAAGSLVLLFILIGAPVLSAAVGGGLIYAGLSGNCMMKQLLMKLPYNKAPA